MRGSIAAFSLSPEIEEKCRRIARQIESWETIGVAFSGGVDSGFLVWLLAHGFKKKVFALLADSPLLPRREKQAARSLTAAMGISLHEVPVNPLAVEVVRSNHPNRCYHCKHALMGALLDAARKLSCDALVEGTQADDEGKHRPGRKALMELGIASPLARAGFSKEDIRSLARRAGLSNWDKAPQSCLAARIPHGMEITTETLHRVEAAEEILWNWGCRQVRVRAHDRLARIEVAIEDFAYFQDKAFRMETFLAFRELGFHHVTLDLAGFQSGSMDDTTVNDKDG